MAAKTICPLGTCWSFIRQKLTYEKLFMGGKKRETIYGELSSIPPSSAGLTY